MADTTPRALGGAAFNALMEEETKESLIAMLFKAWSEHRASRAETEAARAERDAAKGSLESALSHSAVGWDRLQLAKDALEVAERDAAGLRALAAELVEGLEKIRTGDLNGASPVWYFQAAQDVARALIAKARAAGIPPAPEDRTPRVCERCGTLVRGDDRHACAPKGEKGEPHEPSDD